MSLFLMNQSLHAHEVARRNAQHEAASNCPHGYWSPESNELQYEIYCQFEDSVPKDGEGYGMSEAFATRLYKETDGLFFFPNEGLTGEKKAQLIVRLSDLYKKALAKWTMEKEFNLYSRNVDTNFYDCSPPDHERLNDIIELLLRNDVVFSS